jgi:hypothetical protein
MVAKVVNNAMLSKQSRGKEEQKNLKIASAQLFLFYCELQGHLHKEM